MIIYNLFIPDILLSATIMAVHKNKTPGAKRAVNYVTSLSSVQYI